MSERASGWYDDPQDPTLLRYWDGILWSERTMPKVKPDLDDSRIGDSRRQYEEQQARQQAAGQRTAPGGPSQRPPLSPYPGSPQDPYSRQFPGGGRSPYDPARQYAPRPLKATPDGEPTAPWWRRLVAYLIDNILLSILTVVVSWTWLHPWLSTISTWYDSVVRAAQHGKSQPPVPSAVYDVPWQFPLVALLLYLCYEIGLIAWRGRTIGHMICALRVRAATSSAKPGLNAAVIRAVVKGVSTITSFVPYLGSLGSIFTLIDGLVPLGDRRAQALHDKAARTYVVSTRRPKGAQEGPRSPYISR